MIHGTRLGRCMVVADSVLGLSQLIRVILANPMFNGLNTRRLFPALSRVVLADIVAGDFSLLLLVLSPVLEDIIGSEFPLSAHDEERWGETKEGRVMWDVMFQRLGRGV